MQNEEKYLVVISDIKDIKKKKKIDEIIIYADGKTEAMDKAHSEADRLFPNVFKLVEISRVAQY